MKLIQNLAIDTLQYDSITDFQDSFCQIFTWMHDIGQEQAENSEDVISDPLQNININKGDNESPFAFGAAASRDPISNYHGQFDYDDDYMYTNNHVPKHIESEISVERNMIKELFGVTDESCDQEMDNRISNQYICDDEDITSSVDNFQRDVRPKIQNYRHKNTQLPKAHEHSQTHVRQLQSGDFFLPHHKKTSGSVDREPLFFSLDHKEGKLKTVRLQSTGQYYYKPPEYTNQNLKLKHSSITNSSSSNGIVKFNHSSENDNSPASGIKQSPPIKDTKHNTSETSNSMFSDSTLKNCNGTENTSFIGATSASALNKERKTEDVTKNNCEKSQSDTCKNTKHDDSSQNDTHTPCLASTVRQARNKIEERSPEGNSVNDESLRTTQDATPLRDTEPLTRQSRKRAQRRNRHRRNHNISPSNHPQETTVCAKNETSNQNSHMGNVQEHFDLPGEEKEIDLEEIRKENQRLKNARLCQVCKDKQANRMFLPCTHISACSLCSPAVTKCPKCKDNIKGIVSIYYG